MAMLLGKLSIKHIDQVLKGTDAFTPDCTNVPSNRGLMDILAINPPN